MQKTLFHGSKRKKNRRREADGFSLCSALIVLTVSTTLLSSLWAFSLQKVKLVEKEKVHFAEGLDWENQAVRKKISEHSWQWGQGVQVNGAAEWGH